MRITPSIDLQEMVDILRAALEAKFKVGVNGIEVTSYGRPRIRITYGADTPNVSALVVAQETRHWTVPEKQATSGVVKKPVKSRT